MESLDSLDSSNLSAAQYETESRTLTIEFQSGETYAYQGVPPDVWQGFKDAGSRGSYFWRHIRGRYADSRV